MLLTVYGSAQGRQAEPVPCSACVIFVIEARDVERLDPPLQGLEVLLRARAPDDRAALDQLDAQPLEAARRAVERAGGRAGLLVAGDDVAAIDPALLSAASRLIVDFTGAREAGDALLFRVKTLLSELRGQVPDVPLGIAAPPSLVPPLRAADVAPYLDFILTVDPAMRRDPAPGTEAAGVFGRLEQPEGVDGITPAPRWVLRLPDSLDAARRTLSDTVHAARWLHEALVPGGMADVHCGAERQPTYLDASSLDTIAVIRDCPPARVSIVPPDTTAEQAVLSNGTVIVRVPHGEDVFAEGVAVSAERLLSAREVVARHQAAAARLRRTVRTLVSSGTTTLTFEAPGFPAPMTITAETVVFTAPDQVDIEQRDIRVNGIAFHAGGVPRLPLLEPERVGSLPLAIALTARYDYAHRGMEEVGGVRCHVIAFEPRDARETLFAGRAWIAAEGYALVRVAAVQTRLRGPIVQSEQVDEFRLENGSAWLLRRSEVRQIYEGAGHRTPIHRVLDMRHHEVNPPDFDERRQAAYASSSVMLRDTPDGFRYLERDRQIEGPVLPRVSARAASVRTIALGAVIDPNITRPLPFAGLSYVHFDLFGRGGQLNGFFGGTFGQLAVSVPSLAGTRWKAGGRAFGIATSYHDRAFAEGREIYAANLLQRPAHASAWVLRPVTRHLIARIGYELDYTHFSRAESTESTFTVPAAQVAHALRLGLEGQWHGLDTALWWSGARRSGWRAWGDTSMEGVLPGQAPYDPRHGTFQRFGVTAGRSWIASPRLVGRVEAAWMGGQDLDRFSRYSFGTFDNRLRGYPAALIRYDRGAVLRSAAAWSAGRALRLDAFADSAYVRDPGFGRRHRSYTGIGLAAELPGPARTLLSVEWGYGFQGVNTDGTRGTHVVRVSAYKMF